MVGVGVAGSPHKQLQIPQKAVAFKRVAKRDTAFRPTSPPNWRERIWSLFPFDSPGRFGRNIIHHPVNALDLINNPIGHPAQQF